MFKIQYDSINFKCNIKIPNYTKYKVYSTNKKTRSEFVTIWTYYCVVQQKSINVSFSWIKQLKIQNGVKPRDFFGSKMQDKFDTLEKSNNFLLCSKI